MDFNAKTIGKATCPDGKKAIYIVDPSTRGLCVQVTVGGTRSFVYRRKMDGTWRQRKIARFDEMSIPEARAVASEHSRMLAAGRNVFDHAQIAKAEPTLRDLFEAYVTRHAEKKCNTVDDMRKNFDRWFASVADRKASAITRSDAEQLHTELGEKAKYAANRAVQLGRAVYYKAIDWGLFTGINPFAKVSQFDEHSRDRFLTNDEAARLFHELEEGSEVDDDLRALRDFVLLDILTGIRKSAMMATKWSEVDLDAGTWTIPDTKSKNKQGQLIPLGETEIAILTARQAFLRQRAGKTGISPFVFPGEGRTGHQMDVKRSWTTLRRKLGLQDVHIHDLRRSLAATMASQNINLVLIKNTLNQKDIKTTAKVYARTNTQALLEAKQRAHAVWFEAVRELKDKPKDENENVRPIDKSRKARK